MFPEIFQTFLCKWKQVADPDSCQWQWWWLSLQKHFCWCHQEEQFLLDVLWEFHVSQWYIFKLQLWKWPCSSVSPGKIVLKNNNQAMAVALSWSRKTGVWLVVVWCWEILNQKYSGSLDFIIIIIRQRLIVLQLLPHYISLNNNQNCLRVVLWPGMKKEHLWGS